MHRTSPETPPQQGNTPTSPAPRRNKKRTITAFALLLTPPVLMTLALATYALATVMFGSTTNSLLDAQSTIATVTHAILVAIIGLTIIAALPCIIIGLILLTSRKTP